MLAGYRITFRVSDHDLAKIRQAAERLPKAIRGKIIRKGLRAWGERTAKMVKAMTRRKDVRTRRGVKVKIKTYKRGKVIWCGVGVKKGKGPNDVGWKSHFHDQGYRAWKKGIKADGSVKKQPRQWGRNPNPRFVPFSYRRDWRKSLFRRNLGPVIYKIQYMTRPAQLLSPRVREYVQDAIEEAMMEEGRRVHKTS